MCCSASASWRAAIRPTTKRALTYIHKRSRDLRRGVSIGCCTSSERLEAEHPGPRPRRIHPTQRGGADARVEGFATVEHIGAECSASTNAYNGGRSLPRHSTRRVEARCRPGSLFGPGAACRTRSAYVAELKIDGLSIALTYEQTADCRRGRDPRRTGSRGEDVEPPTSRDDPRDFRSLAAAAGSTSASEIRGPEVYLPRAAFERLNREMEDAGRTAVSRTPGNITAAGDDEEPGYSGPLVSEAQHGRRSCIRFGGAHKRSGLKPDTTGVISTRWTASRRGGLAGRTALAALRQYRRGSWRSAPKWAATHARRLEFDTDGVVNQGRRPRAAGNHFGATAKFFRPLGHRLQVPGAAGGLTTLTADPGECSDATGAPVDARTPCSSRSKLAGSTISDGGRCTPPRISRARTIRPGEPRADRESRRT